MWTTNPTSAAALLSLALLAPAGLASADGPCVWNGTAPLCNGECEPGYTLVKRDPRGPADAKKCTTGTKARCCFTSDIQVVGKAPFCSGKCPVGQETLGESDYGHDGDKCVTGKAAICRLRGGSQVRRGQAARLRQGSGAPSLIPTTWRSP